MIRPIDTTEPITFTFDGHTFQRTGPNEYIKLQEDGTKVSVTKESNELMDALMGGEIVDNTIA